MKAYEMYLQDQVNGNEFARKASSRHRYYVSLRQALRDETANGGESSLLTHLGAASPAQLYLLDAAAVWECYEAVIGSSRFPRDVGKGFPFPVNGSRLSWETLQQMAEAGTLPVAVVDEELQARLTGLIAHASAHGGDAVIPPVDGRALLKTAAPQFAVLPGEAVPAESQPQPSAELTRQIETLTSENSLLRSQLEQLRLHRETERDYAVRAAGSILAGHVEEARAAAAQLSGQLEAAVLELERVVTECRELQSALTQTQAQYEADSAQLQALHQQLEAARAAAVEARSARAQAQQDAALAVAERQAAEAELAEDAARLNAATQALRELRRKAAEARAARSLTERQLEALS